MFQKTEESNFEVWVKHKVRNGNGKKGGLDFTFAEYNETKSIQHINHTMRWLNSDRGSETLKDVVPWTLTLKSYSEIAFSECTMVQNYFKIQ